MQFSAEGIKRGYGEGDEKKRSESQKSKDYLKGIFHSLDCLTNPRELRKGQQRPHEHHESKGIKTGQTVRNPRHKGCQNHTDD